MGVTVHYRSMRPGEEAAVCELIARVFGEFLAPEYSDLGVAGFLDYARPDMMQRRAEEDHFVLVATIGDQLVGAIEIREHRHVSLLFVDGAYQRCGIARELLTRALGRCRQRNPQVAEVTVNSSPYAVPIYARFGFAQAKPEQEDLGIRYVPMVKKLGESEFS